MKTIIVTTFFLLSILVSAPLHAKYVPLAEGKHETISEIKEPFSEKEQLLKKIDALQKTVNKIQISKTEERSEIIKTVTDNFSLIDHGSILAIEILAIVLALMGLSGYAVYKLIEYKLLIKHRRMLDDWSNDTFIRVFRNFSHAFYSYYRSFFSNPNYATHPGFKSSVDLALWYAEKMVETANKLDTTRKDKEKIIMGARAHMAYHYAARRSEGDIQTALSIINMLEKHTDLTNFEKMDDWADFKETIAWVKIRSSDPEMIKEGHTIIKQILENKEVLTEIRDEIRENYKLLEKDSDWLSE